MAGQYSEFKGRPELAHKRDRLLRWRSIAIAIVSIYIVLSLALISANAIQSFRTRNTLVDCTDPRGVCYQKGQTRTAAAIRQLIDTILYAELCTEDHPGRETKKQLERCIEQRMKKEGQ